MKIFTILCPNYLLVLTFDVEKSVPTEMDSGF